jgi:hypothetical protein
VSNSTVSGTNKGRDVSRGPCCFDGCLADRHKPPCPSWVNAHSWAGHSELGSDSRFLGDTATFGMTSLILSSIGDSEIQIALSLPAAADVLSRFLVRRPSSLGFALIPELLAFGQR